MADQKISELTALTGANVADDDAIAIVDTSATETKKIVFSELKNALDTATGFVRITGDTMTGDLNVLANVGIGTDSPTTKLQSKGGSISTPTDNAGLIANASASFVVDHGNDYGIYTGYVNSTNDAVGIAATRTLGGALPLSLQPFGGSVGIGTSSPERDLHINGTAANAKAFARFTHDGLASNGLDVGYSSGGYASIYNAENTPMVFSTNATERMRIDSSGNVGIGTSSPSAKLQVAGTTQFGAVGTDGVVQFLRSSDGGAVASVAFQSGTSEVKLNNAISGPMTFYTNNTEAMRIDSSGNLLVGKTSADTYNGTNGIELQASGLLTATRTGIAQILNREDSDGDIAVFRKDGTTVGSIASLAGFTVIGSGDTGILFDATEDAIKPRNSSTASRDAAINLGGSGDRFKDLYLSGGVYLGGTVAANKLDDYEEGTYETAITASGSGTVTLNAAYDDLSYVKVGDIVHVQGFITVSSVSSPTGYFKINLPFTSKSGNAYGASASLSVNGVSTNNAADFWGIVDSNTNYIQVYLGDSSSVQTDSAQTLQGGSDCRLQVTYQVA